MAVVAFRKAERKDVARILEFIRELADYEKMLDEVVSHRRRNTDEVGWGSFIR